MILADVRLKKPVLENGAAQLEEEKQCNRRVQVNLVFIRTSASGFDNEGLHQRNLQNQNQKDGKEYISLYEFASMASPSVYYRDIRVNEEQLE